MPKPQAVDLKQKIRSSDDYWAPKIVTDYNGDDVMLAKLHGAFPFHIHEDTDDFSFVLKGRIRIEQEGAGYEDGRHSVKLGAGQLFVRPRGVRRRAVAEEEAHVLLIEPAGTPNTGDPTTAVRKDRI